MIDPTKNITALAETPVPTASRPFAARKIMEREPSCEQVGFVYQNAAGEPCLDMAGGEFCGNASMSAAALLCAKAGMAAGERRQVTLHVSGAPEAVPVTVTVEAGVFACTVKLPPPEAVTEVTLPLAGENVRLPVVYLPGIAHIMVTKDELDAAQAEREVRGWCETLGTAGNVRRGSARGVPRRRDAAAAGLCTRFGHALLGELLRLGDRRAGRVPG